MSGNFKESERAVLCWLATVDSSNKPNVSPKEIYAETGTNKHIIADIASGRSDKNIRANPAVCVSLIDVFLQRGRKLEGMAEIIVYVGRHSATGRALAALRQVRSAPNVPHAAMRMKVSAS